MDKFEEVSKNFIKICQEKNYKKETCFNMATICCSKQMHEQGYTSEQALEKATEFVKTCKTKEEVYGKILEMAGYKG